MAKKDPNFESTRAAIRKTATRLFTAGGVHSSSLADIAKAAGLSKGTLYYHYPSKESLTLDIAEYHFSRMTDLIFTWIDSLGETLSAADAVDSLISLLLSDPDRMQLHFVLACEALRSDMSLKQRFAAKSREWSVMLEVGSLKMLDSGAKRFRSHASLFFPLLDGYALHLLLGEELDLCALRDLLTIE